MLSKKTQDFFKGQISKELRVGSEYVESTPVEVKHKDKVVFSDIVHKFRLKEHPESEFCYIWDELVGESWGKHRTPIVHDLAKAGSEKINNAYEAADLHILMQYKEQQEKGGNR